MKNTIAVILTVISTICWAQEKQPDSTETVNLNEIIVIGKKTALSQKQSKSLTSVEDYLQKSSKINMIKRGAYAWEPVINNMSTERTVITIDGMRIFGACTDKMDPVTSYVEVSNLSEANVASGQQASCHGAVIGGSVDLKRNIYSQKETGWNGSFTSGYETNNKHKIIGGSLGCNNSNFFGHIDFMHRDADNYKAGNGKKIDFSQFTKYNFSVSAGYFLNQKNLIETSIIYDKATDIGYPALPMDVSLAEAKIMSLTYKYIPDSGFITNWETKVYFNTITHKMDDTKRPSVTIHMDMPGWSDTYGFYSKVKGKFENHEFLADLNSFYNKSVAEMTMYPKDPKENLMFMYTWPDVRTFYNGLSLEDNIKISAESSLRISTNLGFHSNTAADDFGLQSLRIFYPEMEASRNRFLKSFSGNYSQNNGKLEYGFGLAYAERAPSISEGYGFYLYNSNDFYDYIGNPDLKNEKALEGNAFLGLKINRLHSKITTSYFHISDYIIGKIDPNVLPMTIGASGIKIYEALDYATIFNSDLNLEYTVSQNWNLKTQVVYSLGKDNEGNNLPFISPLRYNAGIDFKKEKFNAGILALGNLAQNEFAETYGQTRTRDYLIFNINAGYAFNWNKNSVQIQTGIENVFDKYYTTFSDWNKIPRLGRNVFVNLSFSFNYKTLI
ncbi:iron complex outermembrane receptor protein [Flavobacterium sp. HSC-32F16]|uniref:TonB-dependent receptor n=1 Tax=Flavobacterium sp. HSC-32F16 TaxID=2910964 RepID=UPI0020A237C9|nr:TonB-dependent receptor [Flavobacterium sp. HSC-32F16]MCP2028423.1 iron complex outermembrane receptor protein [Flavobacterium sp. HSC-32F16]